ncbi:MAG: hypothetical protein SOW51_05445 [Oscillospiraceae bacterium]|nr:hypothetical protein [Oscillospiraceae bacterium]
MDKNNNAVWEKYSKTTHFIGRLVSAITVIMLVGAPFLIGKHLGAFPDIGAVGKAFFSVGLVWTVSSVAEFLIYTPMLGSGGGYLAFITGNLINMKIPCAVTARDMVGVKSGTKENEIISTLSIATSSLVTILVLAVGVLALTPLQPLLQSPTLQPAFDNVVPALFGAMAYKYYRKNMSIAVAPLVVMSVLFMLVPSLVGSTSFMIIPAGAIAIGISYFIYKKSKEA